MRRGGCVQAGCWSQSIAARGFAASVQQQAGWWARCARCVRERVWGVGLSCRKATHQVSTQGVEPLNWAAQALLLLSAGCFRPSSDVGRQCMDCWWALLVSNKCNVGAGRCGWPGRACAVTLD